MLFFLSTTNNITLIHDLIILRQILLFTRLIKLQLRDIRLRLTSTMFSVIIPIEIQQVKECVNESSAL